MDEQSDDELQDDIRNPGCKRMLSIEDPDYSRPPDPKRMKEMEERAQDELRERVIKVVDGVLSNAVNDKQVEMEEIDSQILRIQQCLHTLRYCVSSDYYAIMSSVNSDKQSYEAHPSVRKCLGKAPIFKAAFGSVKEHLDLETPNQSNPIACREGYHSLCGNLQSMEENSNNVKTENVVSEGSKIPSTSACLDGDENSSREEVKECKNTEKKLELSKPPSPKYLPPKPPDSEIIAQGRHQKFQSKRRIVVGNTYQYLTPHSGREANDAMRYKWQIYVRVPPQENNIESFVSDVTFILDKSYAPHHIITLKHPPFALSRRGWGEFKVQIVLEFKDNRNKKVQFLHPLVLSRPDDPLALTGLWRLGKENWYDVWVYDGPIDEDSKHISGEATLEDEEKITKLKKEQLSGTVSSQVDQNVTIFHGEAVLTAETSASVNLDKEKNVMLSERCGTENSRSILPTMTSASVRTVKKDNAIPKEVHSNADNCKSALTSATSTSVKMRKVENVTQSDHMSDENCKNAISGVDNSVDFIEIRVSEKTSAMDSQSGVGNSKGENVLNSVPNTLIINNSVVKSKNVNTSSNILPVKEETATSKHSVSNGVQTKMCKIHVRQPDGRLVPYFIPAHMYSLAVNIANKKTTDTNKIKVETDKAECNIPKSDNVSGNVSKILPVAVENSASKNAEDVTIRTCKSTNTDKSVIRFSNTVAPSEIKVPSSTTNTVGVRNSQCTQVKILNLSHKSLSKVSPVTAESSSVSSVQKLVHSGQSNPVLLKSGNLSQSALLQLLSKAGIKDGSITKQQLLSKAGLKTVNLASLQKTQRQLITVKAPQDTKGSTGIHFMPVKIMQDKQMPKLQEDVSSSAQLSQLSSSVQPSNIRFVTNDGKLLSSSSLPKGTIISASTVGSTAIKPGPVKNRIFTVRSADLKGMTANLKEGTSILMPDGKIIAKLSTGIQSVTSQGNNVTSKLNLLQCSNIAGKGRPVQIAPLVIGKGNDNLPKSLQFATLPSSVPDVKSENDQIPLAGNAVLASSSGITPKASTKEPYKQTSLSSLSPKVTKSLPDKYTSILPIKSEAGPNAGYSEKYADMIEVTDNMLEEQILDSQKLWEEKARNLVSISKSCSSVEACVSLWIRALPLVSSSATESTKSLFPYRATSSEAFLKWPLGKQRASEFQRSREVRSWLDKCEVDEQKRWTVRRIVAWSRKHGYTPVSRRELLTTDDVVQKDSLQKQDTSLSCLSNLDNLSQGVSHPWLKSKDCGTQDIDITTADDDLQERTKNPSGSPLKTPSEIISWTDSDRVSGCNWIGRKASELRINLAMEEVIPGCRGDASRAVAWQAALSFMEDLLRSSYCQAWEEKSSDPQVVPPKFINFNHVRDALCSSRPEFDIFTNEGLGVIAKETDTT